MSGDHATPQSSFYRYRKQTTFCLSLKRSPSSLQKAADIYQSSTRTDLNWRILSTSALSKGRTSGFAECVVSERGGNARWRGQQEGSVGANKPRAAFKKPQLSTEDHISHVRNEGTL